MFSVPLTFRSGATEAVRRGALRVILAHNDPER
jgi:DNA repair protein RadC